MKILSAAQIREADAYTIKHEPIKSIDLMERAGERCFEWIYDNAPKIFPANSEERDWVFNVFCGVGNNGGDGLVIARLLARNGYEVKVFVVEFSKDHSPDFEANYAKIQKTKIPVVGIQNPADIPPIAGSSLVVDAIFGTGINRKAEGVAADTIRAINASGATVIAVDMPSGLMDADNGQNDHSAIINAHITLALQFIKLSFLFPENEQHVGITKVINIGIHQSFIEAAESPNFYFQEPEISRLLKIRTKFAHKGHYGHLLIAAGSTGKYGAACLTAKGALRSGTGRVTVLAPKAGMTVIQSSVNEAMYEPSEGEHELAGLFDTNQFDAVAIGPGIGTSSDTSGFLLHLLETCKKPLVIDADALNILALHEDCMLKLPRESILTPHPGEFRRMVGKWNCDYERYQKQVKFSVQHHVYVVLKGAHTAISCPDGKVFFNSSGNPGMATAGSGDVLTGIIASLLAQGYSPSEAAIVGTFIHGRAGDIALWDTGYEAMMAGDILNCLGKAFLSFNLPQNK